MWHRRWPISNRRRHSMPLAEIGVAWPSRWAVGATWHPRAAERTHYDELVRRIRQQLSPDGFAREQAIGRALSPAQAADYALQRERAAERVLPSPREIALGALTQREREVAFLVARGMTNRQ